MCLDYDPNPENDDFSETLAAAQAKAEERKPLEELPEEQMRCGLCKRLQARRGGYWTAAGFICQICAHEMSDESQR